MGWWVGVMVSWCLGVLCQNYTSTAHSPQHTVKTLPELHFLVLCYMPYDRITGKSTYPGNIPSIPDYTKYCIIIACTVTVQLPMLVLHGVCYSYTSVVMISHLT